MAKNIIEADRLPIVNLQPNCKSTEDVAMEVFAADTEKKFLNMGNCILLVQAPTANAVNGGFPAEVTVTITGKETLDSGVIMTREITLSPGQQAFSTDMVPSHFGHIVSITTDITGANTNTLLAVKLNRAYQL